MAVFVEANPPEILRAAQKDESFIAQIRGELSDIVQRLLGKDAAATSYSLTKFILIGNRAWLKYQWISDLSSVFLYYSLTTLLDNQTLGEEYVGLLQVDSSLRAIPSKLVLQALTKERVSTNNLISETTGSHHLASVWTEDVRLNDETTGRLAEESRQLPRSQA